MLGQFDVATAPAKQMRLTFRGIKSSAIAVANKKALYCPVPTVPSTHWV